MDRVAFISTEDGDDLIVSFAVMTADPGEVASVILLRTPKYEHIMDEAERGVSFSDERSNDESQEMLCELHVKADLAAIKTDRDEYELDLSGVDPTELHEAGQILTKMNFDRQFQLTLP